MEIFIEKYFKLRCLVCNSIFERVYDDNMYRFNLIVAIVMIILSFWTQEMPRLILNSVALLILSAIHIVIADFAPHNYVPPLGTID